MRRYVLILGVWCGLSLRLALEADRFYFSVQDGGNDLDVSPANPEVSKPRSPTEGGAEGSGKE